MVELKQLKLKYTNTKETQQVMGNKKKKAIPPPPPITIGPFSPRIAKIFQDELNKEKNGK